MALCSNPVMKKPSRDKSQVGFFLERYGEPGFIDEYGAVLASYHPRDRGSTFD